MTLKVPKTHVPNPSHATNNVERFIKDGIHMGMQVASGHYIPNGGSTTNDGHGNIDVHIKLKHADVHAPCAPAPE